MNSNNINNYNNNINILQLNVNGFNKKYDQIKLLIQYHNPDIICVQETNFKNDNNKPK